MTDFLYLVPIALGLGLAGLAAFMWAMRSGQYDDLDGAAERILVDDDIGSQPVALMVATLLNRPVEYSRYGDDVDPMTTPRFTMEPGDLPAALRLARTPDQGPAHA